MRAIEIKKKIVDEVTSEYKDSDAIFISDYSGLNVAQITDLRSELGRAGFKATVQKNRLIQRVFKNIGIDVPQQVLKGQNIFFTTDSDVVQLSKILVNFSKDNEKFEIKGGVLEGGFVDHKQVSKLATLPSKPELIAKTVGLIKGPLSGLVGTLSSPVNGFINVLNNIKNNK